MDMQQEDVKNASIGEVIEKIYNYLDFIKNGDNSYLSKFIYEIKNLRSLVNESNSNLIVSENIEFLFSEVFNYLSNNDKKDLNKIENTLNNLRDSIYGNKKKNTNIINGKQVEESLIKITNNRKYNLNFNKIDKQYINLYNSLNKDDKKEIIASRGRLIRVLKNNDKKIEKAFELIRPLYLIENIINSKFSLEEKKQSIIKILSSEGNEDYYKYFEDSLNDLSVFSERFNYLCNLLNYKKIINYRNDYKNQLNLHGRELKKKYKTDFLDKNIGFGKYSKTLGNSMATSIKILGNTINEFKEAKTLRKKIVKARASVFDMGRILTTPVIAGVKIFKDNWYTLYMLSKGMISLNKGTPKAKSEEKNNSNKSSDINKKTLNDDQKVDDIGQNNVSVEPTTVSGKVSDNSDPSATEVTVDVSNEDTPVPEDDVNLVPTISDDSSVVSLEPITVVGETLLSNGGKLVNYSNGTSNLSFSNGSDKLEIVASDVNGHIMVNEITTYNLNQFNHFNGNVEMKFNYDSENPLIPSSIEVSGDPLHSGVYKLNESGSYVTSFGIPLVFPIEILDFEKIIKNNLVNNQNPAYNYDVVNELTLEKERELVRNAAGENQSSTHIDTPLICLDCLGYGFGSIMSIATILVNPNSPTALWAAKEHYLNHWRH